MQAMPWLGSQLIARERHLETLFATAPFVEAQLEQLVADNSGMQRATARRTPRAHSDAKELSSRQNSLRHYDVLRGYDVSSPPIAILTGPLIIPTRNVSTKGCAALKFVYISYTPVPCLMTQAHAALSKVQTFLL